MVDQKGSARAVDLSHYSPWYHFLFYFPPLRLLVGNQQESVSSASAKYASHLCDRLFLAVPGIVER